MNEGRVERRLAAILAADVAGYSRLIGEDEEGTLAALRTMRRATIDPTIAQHRGRIVKTTGDGLLAEFQSVIDALRCATAWQAAVATDSPIAWRIGIHQGDIVVEEGDIFGDGVNVAARLEALAEPGGICVSARVQEDSAGRLDLAFGDLGDRQLRNIARPVHVFTLDVESARSAASHPSDPVPRISLVVLPFASLSPNPDQEYFADAITDDLTAALSRIPDSFVIARMTAFAYKGRAVDVRRIARELGVRYVLDGSVRRFGERIQVTVQLLDGEAGSHVWVYSFDTYASDPADALSEIVGRIATPLELLKDIMPRIEQEHTRDPDVRDLVLRARAQRGQLLNADLQERHATLAVLERTLVRDPGSIDARIEIAMILVNDVADGFSTSVEHDGARAEQLISEALDRKPNSSMAHRVMGMVRRIQGRWAESQMELERALTLDPYNSAALRQLGITFRCQGKPEAAIPCFEKVIRIEGHHRYAYNGYNTLGHCHLLLGHVDEAVDSKSANPRAGYVVRASDPRRGSGPEGRTR